MLVRIIEYRIRGHQTLYRLATSLLDEKRYPALELAVLYHERWEVETFLDEVKTHQQGRPNGQPVAIHAQLPAGVVQEVYGLALAHRVVRMLMAGTAAAEGLDPDRLSFKHALVIVRRYLPALAQARKKDLPPPFARLLFEIAQERLPSFADMLRTLRRLGLERQFVRPPEQGAPGPKAVARLISLVAVLL